MLFFLFFSWNLIILVFTRALISANHISQAKKMRQHRKLKVIPHLRWWGMAMQWGLRTPVSRAVYLLERFIHTVTTLNQHLESRETPSANCSDYDGMVLGDGLFPTNLNRNRALGFYSSLAPQTFIQNRAWSPVINIKVIKLSTEQDKLSSLGVNLPTHFWKFYLLKKHRMFSNLKSRPFPRPLHRQSGWLLFLLTGAARRGFCTPFPDGAKGGSMKAPHPRDSSRAFSSLHFFSRGHHPLVIIWYYQWAYLQGHIF